MGKITPGGKKVIDYLDKNPDMPSLTLAKLIFKNHPLEFGSTENIRTIIRYYRGRRGDEHRNTTQTRKHFKPLSEGINFAPYKPKEESADQTPYQIKGKNIGIVADLHIPNHRNEPIGLAVDYLKKKEIDTLIINGDLLDNTPFTRFTQKPPTPTDVRRWFDKAELFLEYFRNEFPKAEIIWAEGNHDFWYKRWMWSHAWQLDDDPYFTLQQRLHIDECGIVFIPQERFLMAGKLAICHGHYLIRGIITPVNAARGAYLKAKRSVLIGHVHVESSHTETDIHGEIVTTWSTGCLCTLTPDYMPMAGKGCHGFAHVTVTNKGDFSVNNFRIHKGIIL